MQPRLRNLHLAAYAAPGVGLSLFISPFPAIIAAFYASHTAATTAGIATALLLVRVTDTLIDIGIGYASDATRTRIGGRKPWMLLGMMIGVAAASVLFFPSASSSAIYFAFGIALYYLALGSTDIPLRSWISELTSDYAERARIAAWLTFAILMGGMGFLLLPEGLSSSWVGLAETSAIDRDMMAIYGWCAMIFLPTGVILAVLIVPPGKPAARVERPSWAGMVAAVRINKPYQLLIGAEISTQIAWGLIYALLFVAFETYFGLGDHVALILVAATAAQILCVPIYSSLSKHISRHRLWAWSSIMTAIFAPFTLLFQKDTPEQFIPMAIFIAILSALGTAQMMFPMAMVGDVADYDTLKSGARRTGLLYAMRLMVFKATFAAGNAAGFYILSLVGYDPKAAVNSSFSTWGMLLTLTVLPSIFFLMAGVILLRFPIDARRHAIIVRRISSRAKGIQR